MQREGLGGECMGNPCDAAFLYRHACLMSAVWCVSTEVP